MQVKYLFHREVKMSIERKIKYFKCGGKDYTIIDTKRSSWIEGAYGFGGCSHVTYDVEIRKKGFWIFYTSVFKKVYTAFDRNTDRIEAAKNEYFFNRY